MTGEALRNYSKRSDNEEKIIQALDTLADIVGMSTTEVMEQITMIGRYPELSFYLIERLSEVYKKGIDTAENYDIPYIKKRIKHCKNPLERKMLERELNVAYKDDKKRRKLSGR